MAHLLTPDLFSFQKSVADQLSENLFPHMASILCSPQPMLEAAKVNSVAEFERLYGCQPQHKLHLMWLLGVFRIDLMWSTGTALFVVKTRFANATCSLWRG